jgi:uncharacterized protein (DUF1015 family)
MSDIRPFCGIRPRPDLVAQVAAPPYDVVDFDEAQAYVVNKPHSFLRVEKSEIELPRGLETLDPRIFEHGKKKLQELLTQDILVRDTKPSFYVYQLRMGKHVQVGVVAGASLAEYQHSLIKKHEFTRTDKEDERTLHINTLGANTGPVFLTYRSVPAIDDFISTVRKRKKVFDFVADDGVGHTLWVLSNPQEIERLRTLFAAVPALYIADGHHRSAAAARVQKIRQEQNPHHTGSEPYNFFLTVIFPHDQMNIMEYNRVVNDLNGRSIEAFMKAVSEKFDIGTASQPKPEKPTTFGMYIAETWHRLTAKPGTFPTDDPVESLDASILQNNLLNPLLGIDNPRTNKRIQFVGGIRGTAELERRVQQKGGVAFAMYPTSIKQLMAIADANTVMPPKSTWFEPKLRSGVVVRSIID